MKIKLKLPGSKDRLKSTWAFTLVEMLVSVFIIAVFISLLLPVFKSLLTRGAALTCANNMRQIGAAFLAYSAEHNGWFPPGYPMSGGSLANIYNNKGLDTQWMIDNPMPPQSGLSNYKFEGSLVPDYMDALPICPMAQLAPGNNASSRKAYFKALSGTYTINSVLFQMKVVSLPPWYWGVVYRRNYFPDKMTFLIEGNRGGTTWSWNTANAALKGEKNRVLGRDHGRGDKLNFLFLDNHAELIGPSDAVRPPPYNLSSTGPQWSDASKNPNSPFRDGGDGVHPISPSGMSDNEFYATYPQYFPPQ